MEFTTLDERVARRGGGARGAETPLFAAPAMNEVLDRETSHRRAEGGADGNLDGQDRTVE